MWRLAAIDTLCLSGCGVFHLCTDLMWFFSSLSYFVGTFLFLRVSMAYSMLLCLTAVKEASNHVQNHGLLPR